MSCDSFDPNRQMFPANESHTYKNINLKNETSFCFEDDETIKQVNIQTGSKSQKNQNYPIVEIQSLEPYSFQQDEQKIDINQLSPEVTGMKISEVFQVNKQDKVIQKQQDQKCSLYISKKESTNSPSLNYLSMIQVQKCDTRDIKVEVLDCSDQHKQQRRKGIQSMKNNKNNGAILSLFMLTRVKPKILNYIQQFTSFGRTRCLNKNISSIINDPIDYEFSNYKLLNHRIFSILMFDQIIKLFQIMENLFFDLLSFIPLFNPENKLRICINLIIACYSSFYLYITSLHIFFNADFGSYEELFHQIAIAAWISEMLLSMNTFCYHHGQFITDRKQIFRIYIKEYFFFEFLPLIFEGRQSENIFYNVLLHLPLLLKLQGISIIMNKIEFFVLQHIKYPQYIQFLKLVFQILLLTHFMACSYYAFGQFEKYILEEKNAWFLNGVNGDKSEWWQLYFEAQYWAFLTMSSSFSMSVNTQYEQIFTSFWMLISCILYAFLVNMIGDILREVNSQSESFKRNLNILNRYMKRKKVKIELQREMNIHLKKNYEHFSKKSLEEEKEALNQLGNEMKQKLIIESNKKFLCQFPFFQQKLSTQSLNLLYTHLEEETYIKGEYLTLRDQHNDDPFLYLIVKGEITLMYDKFNSEEQNIKNEQDENKNVYIDKDDKEKINLKQFQKSSIFNLKERTQKQIKRLGVGKCIGEFEFFTNLKQNYIAKCSKKSIVVKIVRSQLIQILKQNDQDYEKFKLSQDLLAFKNDLSQIQDLNCFFCQSDKHLYQDCHFVHFSKINPFIIPKSNKSVNQERQKFERKKKSLKWTVKKRNEESKLEQTEDNMSTLRYISEFQEQINNESEDQNNSEKNIEQVPHVSKNMIFSKASDCYSLTYNIQEDQQQNEIIIQNSSHITPTRLRSKSKMCSFKEETREEQQQHIESPSYSSQMKEYAEKQNNCSVFTSPLIEEQKQMKEGQEETHKRHQKKSKLKNIPEMNESTFNNNYKKHQTLKQIHLDQQNQYASIDLISNKNQIVDQNNYNGKFNDKQIFATWNESLAYWLFDKYKDYTIYFPSYNHKEIIKKNMIQKKNVFNKKKKIIVQKSKVSQMATLNQQ
ncbi:cyclic nucleotide-binding domain protein (macronuclear) [Tetrahymena thermophila SB210]|uniref:Cyclic nucleotide-binding domain protein n=1 Tax=Tetrahymena thermophila (strain SB210) TaxID=312017 RepID=I7MB14_TETTS|nr:cyclic nucleotide-binding domain protein [Tetrahymena thermophila SB210]EAS07111.2 cyclic nucleotide-binding domain protein [Tetrahymena thermophila SB210]|eukprot:XP_001027353.2 cyclic nucleotide-binding domain protein [Tetrahymena thermophila SB210]